MEKIENKIREKIDIALKIVSEIDDPYKLETYKIILPIFLREITTISSSSVDLSKTEGLALSEIISKLKPTHFTDTAIIISYFLFKFNNITRFNIDHIRNGFDEVRAVKPQNMTDTLNSLIKRGLLRRSSDEDGKKGFEITNMGIKYSEDIIKNLD